MKSSGNLDRSKKLANDLSTLLDDLNLCVDDRTRISAACYFAALEHHVGITILLENQIPSPAMALLRPLYEASVRGTWIHSCATDTEIETFKSGSEPPPIRNLIEALEKTEAFDLAVLSGAHGKNWPTLCGLTHTGIQQVLLCISEDGIERNCPPELIDEALGYAGAHSLLSAIGVARLADNDVLACRLLDLGKAFVSD